MNEKEDMEYQIELLKIVKNELGMSQSDISRKFEIGTSSVSSWAKQKIKMPTSVKIALQLMLKEKESQEFINAVKEYHIKMNNIVQK